MKKRKRYTANQKIVKAAFDRFYASFTDEAWEDVGVGLAFAGGWNAAMNYVRASARSEAKRLNKLERKPTP